MAKKTQPTPAPRSPTKKGAPAPMPKTKTTSLNVDAPPYVPALGWKTPLTDDLIWTAGLPYTPGSEKQSADGFVILDQVVDYREVPDEELFDPAYYPFTTRTCMNELLAELEILDMQEELHRKLFDKCVSLQENRRSVEPMVQNILKRTTKTDNALYQTQKANKSMHYKLTHHGKSPRFSRQICQPRASY
ncbi:hypothetical protein SPRG_13171 [Saprolegnia parasitica CBS 223.65]|uniref:Uncharacterized protein n=1 Tax=Saprolegnia parasitica (strain CBS 223.65) TaxID=695850 RepID=A0A067C5E5_SAPPC|nr:hypothetical protein SPRG_13171 [Saprolegnia parasitica CBS 223.65]KDO21756.1 hypothetical protein SPRG_13171 [Saprolegnia parasitica CBS 223.65]|eukprot:XP_012207557.1 hypothetical protein SPRG_13171 [Saprolegnia parasitica CBS 223.65]